MATVVARQWEAMAPAGPSNRDPRVPWPDLAGLHLGQATGVQGLARRQTRAHKAQHGHEAAANNGSGLRGLDPPLQATRTPEKKVWSRGCVGEIGGREERLRRLPLFWGCHRPPPPRAGGAATTAGVEPRGESLGGAGGSPQGKF